MPPEGDRRAGSFEDSGPVRHVHPGLLDREERLLEGEAREVGAHPARDVAVHQETLRGQEVQDPEDVGEIHLAQPHRERTLAGGLLARGLHHHRARRVAVGAAGRLVLVERILGRQGQLRVGPRHRAPAPDLEPVAGPLARHQELRHPEEPALEAGLQHAQRPLSHRLAAHEELLPQGREVEDHRAVAGDRRELGEEEARVAAGSAQLDHHVCLGEGQGLVAVVGVEGRSRHARGPVADLRGSGQRRLGGPEGQPQDRRHLDHVLGGRGEGQALHVDQARR